MKQVRGVDQRHRTRRGPDEERRRKQGKKEKSRHESETANSVAGCTLPELRGFPERLGRGYPLPHRAISALGSPTQYLSDEHPIPGWYCLAFYCSYGALSIRRAV